MKMNNLLVSFGYSHLLFENLTPGEIGQLTVLLGKANVADDRYVDGRYKYVKTEEKNIEAKLLKDPDILTQSQWDAYQKEQEDKAEAKRKEEEGEES